MKYRFDGIVLDSAARELSGAEGAIAVEPKVFDLLLYLIENRDRVVAKDELVEAVWEGRFISDAAVSSCISAARRALGDDGRTQRYLKTAHRRGFRFVGPVETLAKPADVGVQGGQSSISEDPADADLPLPNKPSLAVLQFECEGEEQQRLLANALARDITVGLARTRWLFVSSSASAERLAMTAHDPLNAAGRLGVRYLLHGAIRFAADRFRLTVALSDVTEGSELWAESYDRRLEDVFMVEDEITSLVVAAVEFEIDLRERRRAALAPIESLDGWTAYHQANDLLLRFSPDRYDRAESLLNLASRLDPTSSRVFAAMSFLYWQRAYFGSADAKAGYVARAIDYAQHSLSLDPLDPQGHWALGRTGILSGDLDLSVEQLSSAVALNPNFAHAHYSLGYSLMLSHRSDDAIESVGMAQRIGPYDPLSFAYMAAKAQLMMFSGDDEAAVVWSRRAARQPNAHSHIYAIAAWVHEAAGRHADAQSYVSQIKQERPDYSARDFFRAIPFSGEEHLIVKKTFESLGI